MLSACAVRHLQSKQTRSASLIALFHLPGGIFRMHLVLLPAFLLALLGGAFGGSVSQPVLAHSGTNYGIHSFYSIAAQGEVTATAAVTATTGVTATTTTSGT